MDSNNLKKSDIFHNKAIAVFFVLVVCFTSGHALQTINLSLQRLVFVAFICVLLPSIREITKKKLNIYSFAAIGFSLMICLTAVLYLGKASYTYFMLLIFVLTAFGITTVYSFEEFVDIYLKIMTVVSVVSLIGYYLVNNTTVLNTLPSFVNVNGVEYKVGFIFNYIVTIPERNCGMFWEPGLFASNLIFALVFEMVFKARKLSIIRVAVFSACIITANSSAGFLLLFFCLWLLFTKSDSKRITPFSFFVRFLLFVFGIFVVLNIDQIIKGTVLRDNEYFVKLLSENILNSSRVRSVLFNLEIFLKNPIFGAGYTGVYSQMNFAADTATSVYILSVFGILGSFYTFFWVYGVFKIKNINIISKLIVSAIFLSILNKEPHLNILLTWIVMFYLLKDGAFGMVKSDDIKTI